MTGALVVSRLLLAVAFAVAGLRKLADPPAAHRTVRSWGVPTRLVGGTVAGLTFAEMVVAAGLVSGGATAWAAAVVALGCLVVPVVAMMAHRQPDAAQLPVLTRAATLAIPAGLVLWHGFADAGPGVATWFAALPTAGRIAVPVGAVVLATVATVSRPAEAQPARRAPPEIDTRLSAAPLIRPAPELTIGMATYDDFDGVYFTIQALRLYHDLDDTELVVVDNYGCPHTRDLVRTWAGGRYVLATDVVGTASSKDLVFRTASGAAVLCCDSHVLFEPGVIARLKRFHRDHPTCGDLLQGPLVYDDGNLISTHFDPVWRGQMWGVWATDPRGTEPGGEPFEIPMQGLGAFSCRADAWPGFHPGFRGFGGEEGYLHEKFRRAGRRCLCLPWFRWMHRFGRPRGTPYPLTIEDKLRNYVLGHAELGLDLAPVLAHFSGYLPADRVADIAERAVAEART